MNEVKDLTKSKQSEIPETDSKKNELIIFNNPDFDKVRTMLIDNEPWFVGKDVASALGFANPQEAIRYHVDEEDKGVRKYLTPGGTQETVFINESGVYALIFGSKLPDAKKFKHWVTSEILPSLRKKGYFSINGAKSDKEIELEFMAMAVKMREAEYKVMEARNNNAEVFMRLADTAYRRDDKRFYQSMACNAAAGCNVMPIFGKIRSDIRTRYTVGDLSVEFECTKDFIKFLIDKLGLDSADFAICYPSDDGDKSKDFYVYNYDAYLVIREYFKAYGKDRLERILIEHRITDLLPDKSPMGTSLFSVN